MEDLAFKFEDCIISPLHENLTHLEVDPSNLIEASDDNNNNKREIGMANFRKKIKSPKSPTRDLRQLWRTAAKKIKLLKDPWYEFHIQKYPVENVIRHRYNPGRKEWRTDECVVKMEKYRYNSILLTLKF